ncbi:hypothetical protein AN189_12920 [Loktanella sp. 3ANDIMAR09]|uniref:hypothetical protein n=1 Tax=Loktanella sp. 3ANDIMAR09 TaxID=1225657 RepID=UPI000701B2C3|nr:hypothetical protein [Loktanella sp. 3ANDIMAR09]KQI67975.1 hypothetical protein AN189_12920 [Loktanella sp. 3ANDIMAR09]
MTKSGTTYQRNEIRSGDGSLEDRVIGASVWAAITSICDQLKVHPLSGRMAVMQDAFNPLAQIAGKEAVAMLRAWADMVEACRSGDMSQPHVTKAISAYGDAVEAMFTQIEIANAAQRAKGEVKH